LLQISLKLIWVLGGSKGRQSLGKQQETG